MLPYSEEFIKTIDKDKVLDGEVIVELLDERIKNFKDPFYMVDDIYDE